MMAKNTSITLGNHFDDFITGQIESGRFSSASEVVRAGLRLLENSETKIEILRSLLKEGEESGIAEYNYDNFMAELDAEYNT
jgi:antitoxin ParD1/3/4